MKSLPPRSQAGTRPVRLWKLASLAGLAAMLGVGLTPWTRSAQAEASADLLGSVANVAGKLRLSKLPAPVTVTAGRMEFDYDDGLLSYTGGVEVEHAGMTLKSDQLVIEFEPGAKQSLRKMVAKGNVTVLRGEERATGGVAVYNPVSATVTLSENAKLSSGPNSLEGPRVVVFLDERRAIVEGDGPAAADAAGSQGPGALSGSESGRVRVVLTPEAGESLDLGGLGKTEKTEPTNQAEPNVVPETPPAPALDEERIEEVEGQAPDAVPAVPTPATVLPERPGRGARGWNRAPRKAGR